jgi:hypothetical protein
MLVKLTIKEVNISQNPDQILFTSHSIDCMTLKIAKLNNVDIDDNFDDNFDDLDENDPDLLEYEKQLEQYEQAYDAYLNSYKDWADQYGQDANPPQPKAEVSSKRRRRRYFSKYYHSQHYPLMAFFFHILQCQLSWPLLTRIEQNHT